MVAPSASRAASVAPLLLLLLLCVLGRPSGLSYAAEAQPVETEAETEIADPNGETESLTFYVHCTDEVAIVAGPGKEQPDLSLLNFGSTLVYDNNVTAGPSADSKLIGRRQGLAIKNNHANTNYYLLFTVIFEHHEKYSGTLQVAGTEIGSGDREISIVGGTGDFRGARGYSTFYQYSDVEYPIIKQDFVVYQNSFKYRPSSSSMKADI